VGGGIDGPSHFLTSRAPTGATLLKRRHLELLGHALVTVPYWEWERCKSSGEREQYLRYKLAQFVQRPGNVVSSKPGKSAQTMTNSSTPRTGPPARLQRIR